MEGEQSEARSPTLPTLLPVPKETLPSPSPPPPTQPAEPIVEKPTRKSLSAHVASTIHFLASKGPRSHSNTSRTSQTSSQMTEPPLTHARPPASPEEVDEQLDRILYAIDQLQQLQARGRYIAAREVRSLRRAFLFAVGEEQQYREAVLAEAEGNSMASAAASGPTTPALSTKTPPPPPSHAHKTRKGQQRKAAASVAHEAPQAPVQEDTHAEVGEAENVEDDDEEAHATSFSPFPVDAPAPVTAGPPTTTSTSTWLAEADPPADGTPSPLQPLSHQTIEMENNNNNTRHDRDEGHAAGYSPKAAAADRLLAALEQYVDETPTSSSFDMNGARFSWRSIIHTPGERRLQSLVMSLFIFFTGIPICMTITALLLVVSRYTAPLMLLYILWMFTFGRPNFPHRKSRRFTRFFLWRYYRDYFPIRLVVPKPVRRAVDRERNYFFVYHPHGIHTFGALINFGLDTNDLSEMLPGVTVHLQTLKVNLFVPFWRHLTIWMGCGDASAPCIRKTLRSGPGQSIMLVVGGAEESLMSKPNANDLLLLKRKGFIKIALQEGTPLVPVYGFGENNVYNVADMASEPDVQHLLGLFKHYLGFAIPLVKGRGFFNFNYGILPHRRPIVVVVGEPIELPRIAQPTIQDLDYWQGKYIEGLQKLYDEHRGIYDLEATGLRILR